MLIIEKQRLSQLLRFFLGLLILGSAFLFNSIVDNQIAYAADCTTTTTTVTQASFHEVVVDEPNLDSTYVAYKIDTGVSDSFNDLWVRAENFSDATKLSLATNEDGLYHVGPMDTSTVRYVYFYVNASATNTAQTYTLNLFEGNPTYGTSFCTHTASHDKVSDEIQAAANKVTSVVNTAPYIGGTMTITVTGDTGTMSSSRPEGSVFVMTPASVDAWPADCYELFDTTITFTGANTGTYNDDLVVTGLNSAASSYTVVYSFKATCTTATPTSVTPVNFISSGGTNLKHTDTGTTTYTSIPPVPPAENRMVMTKSVSPGGSAGAATPTYTLTFTNTAPIALTVDSIQDTLASSPATTSLIASTSFFDGISVPEPNISGQVLTWGGSFVVPANSSKVFTYDVNIPATNGNYVNSATAFIGNTQIDQTIDTTNNTPATTSFGVGDPNLSSSTKSSIDQNGGNVEPGDVIRYTISVINSGTLAATGVDVTDTIDTDTDTLTNVVVAANASSCGSSFVDSSTSTALNVVDVDVAAGGGNCDITFDVTVKAGTADNTDILNTATISAANEGGVGGSPSSTPLTVQLVPVLSVTKTENDADNYVLASSVNTYTVTISNSGDTAASGVDIDDTITGPVSLVDNFTFTNCGSTYSNASALQVIEIANVDVAVGVDCVVTYDVTVDAGATNGQTIDNAANVSAADEGGNDPAVVNATQLTVGVAPVPNLSVTKTENDADNTVLRGQTVTYTVTISNSGTGSATTSFTDTIDTDYGSPSNFGYTNCGGSESSGFVDPTLTVSNVVVTTSNDCVVTYDVTVGGAALHSATLVNSVDVAQASEGGNDPAAVAATTLTVDAQPVLGVTKSENDADDIVTPGQTVSYTVTIANTGTITATTSFTDTIDADYGSPSNFGYTNCGGSESSGFVAPTLTVSNLVVTTTNDCVVTYDVVVDTPLNEGVTLTNSADVAQASEGGNNPAAVAATTLTVDATPNLAVSKTDNDADNSVTPGQTVTYSVTITNSGDGNATTSFTDVIDTDYGTPSNFGYTNCGGSESSGFVDPTLTISNLVVSTAVSCVVTYDVVVDNPSTEGASITNSVDVTQATEGGNNPAAATADTLTVDVTPALTVTKTDNDADNSVTPSQTITYSVTVGNTGNGPGLTSFTDVIDSDVGSPSNFGYTNCGGSESSGFVDPTLTISNLVVTTVNDCVVTYDVVVDSGAIGGSTITNSADVAQATEGGNNPATATSDTLTVATLPNLAVTKTENDADDIVTPGQTVTYTVTIVNTGNATGTTSFTDTIDTDYGSPSNFGYTNCGGSESSGFVAPTLTVSNLAVTTASACIVTYDIVVDTPLNEGVTLTNSADVAQASEGGNNPAAVAATTLTVDATPVLGVTKTDNDADNFVTPGQTITYTINIQNTGDGEASTSFIDTIDSDLGSPSNFGYTNCGGSESSGFVAPTLTVSNVTIAAGVTCVVTYDVVVDSPSVEGATITNSANVAQATEGGNDPAVATADTLTVDVTPNLSTSTKTENDADNSVTPGQTVSYTMTLINSGNGVASGVDISDTVDTDMSVSPSTISITNCGSSYIDTTSTTAITVTGLDVAVGTNCVVVVDVIVDTPLDEGTTLDNTVTISAADEGGAGASPSAPTLTVNATPALSTISSENDVDNLVLAGEVIEYTNTITNSGDGSATGINFSDVLSGPVGTISNIVFTGCGTFTNTSSGLTVSATGIDVGTSGSCTVTFDITVSSGAADGQTITNNFDVTAATEGGNNPAAISADTLVVDGGSPDAVNDTAEVPENSTGITIDWDNNDSLVDSAALDSFDATSTMGGTVTNAGGGNFNYIPAVDFFGTDSFTYTICDNDTPTATCDTATINVTVQEDSDGDGNPNVSDGDDDQDGIDDVVEGAGPNGGDANGDGTPDNTQSNVSSLPNDQNDNKYVSLDSDDAACGIITSFSVKSEDSFATQSDLYDFPIGLFDFTIKCTAAGDATKVTFYLDAEYDTSEWTFVKYDRNTGDYSPFNELVTYGTATVGSNTVTTMSYIVTDGQFLDEDGSLNANIVDPAGPAIAINGLTNTGRSLILDIIIGSFLLITALFINSSLIGVPRNEF